jgi:hypothetical protein
MFMVKKPPLYSFFRKTEKEAAPINVPIAQKMGTANKASTMKWLKLEMKKDINRLGDEIGSKFKRG